MAIYEWQLLAIYPSHIAERAKNQDSCAFSQNDRLKILLTGDSGVEQERQFAHQLGKIDFLQVGHHGSKALAKLYRLPSQHLQWISAGRWNPWKLPNKQIERLNRRHINVLNTVETGMIRVKFTQVLLKLSRQGGIFPLV